MRLVEMRRLELGQTIVGTLGVSAQERQAALHTPARAGRPDEVPQQSGSWHRATLVIATLGGLLLDLLATGDRDRVQDVAESFFAALEQGALRAPADTDTLYQR